MKLIFLAVGKAHDPDIKSAIDDFTKRISNYYQAEWHLLPVPKNASSLSQPEQKAKESELILDNIKSDDHLIALDERGKQFTSEQLAAYITKQANESKKRLIFVIGGAFGLGEPVLARANTKWSLSQLTFPHQLVRLILAEQVYRACTIIRNEKYHH
jgi:23S rRNA (pseudouridine1915-N3)-methyltransferase